VKWFPFKLYAPWLQIIHSQRTATWSRFQREIQICKWTELQTNPVTPRFWPKPIRVVKLMTCVSQVTVRWNYQLLTSICVSANKGSSRMVPCNPLFFFVSDSPGLCAQKRAALFSNWIRPRECGGVNDGYVLMFLCVCGVTSGEEENPRIKPVAGGVGGGAVRITWRALQVLPAEPLWLQQWLSAGSVRRIVAAQGPITAPPPPPRWWWSQRRRLRASPASRPIDGSVWFVQKTSAAAIIKDGRLFFVNLYSTWPGPSRWVSARIKPIPWPWPTFYPWK